jgi:uncharacterized protein
MPLSLPLLSANDPLTPDGILPLSNGKTCGTGCGSGAGGCHTETAVRPQTPVARTRVEIPFGERRLNLDAIAARGLTVTSIDMDVTVECNLRCTYCFKEKWTEHMEEQIAFDAITWLLHSAGTADAHVAFMGGEPLIRFKMIKKLVPFAKRRAAQRGQSISFSMTTNGTLVTDEVVRFWEEWGLGFHTSIDGPPEIQDRNRPTTGGNGSSRLVEKAVPKILGYAPRTTARCTVVPDSAGSLSKSYRYFRSLGYTDIAFVPGGPSLWDDSTLSLYEREFFTVAELVMDDLRRGHAVNVKGFDDYANSRIKPFRSPNACGAGRGMVLIDIHGDIWPCHRWNKQDESTWRIGSIYEQFDDSARESLDVPSFVDLLKNDCGNCEANLTCSGGCPAENLEETGTVYRRHDNACELQRVWVRAGKLVYETMTAERNQTYLDHYCRSDNDIGVFH